MADVQAVGRGIETGVQRPAADASQPGMPA